ncbi:protein of unknown function (plasmid) [Caballeronia sp. S22]
MATLQIYSSPQVSQQRSWALSANVIFRASLSYEEIFKNTFPQFEPLFAPRRLPHREMQPSHSR